MMYPYYSYGQDPSFWLLSGVWHVVSIILLVVFAVWVIRRFRGSRGMHWRGCWSAHSGLSILNERYAKGEIDKAEYEERKKTLLGE